MTKKKRRAFLYIALAGVAAWSAWLAINEPSDQAETRLVVAAKSQRRTPPLAHENIEPSPTVPQAKIQEAEPRLALSRANLFPRQTWFVPPPPPPPLPYVLPPPPQAPPLPYTYMGRWQEASQTTYYLTRGDAPVSVMPGQVLDGAWRLEPGAQGMLIFTYLPLNQTRSLRTGE
ncbi:MAG: hypothetical protein ACYCZL_02270 [Polaromonas sp.]